MYLLYSIFLQQVESKGRFYFNLNKGISSNIFSNALVWKVRWACLCHIVIKRVFFQCTEYKDFLPSSSTPIVLLLTSCRLAFECSPHSVLVILLYTFLRISRLIIYVVHYFRISFCSKSFLFRTKDPVTLKVEQCPLRFICMNIAYTFYSL